jgi:hypothetical protein
MGMGPLLLAVALAASSLAGAAATRAEGIDRTHLLAMAACPPWKEVPGHPELTRAMAESCANNVALVVDGLSRVMPIADGDVVTLVDEEATHKGVASAMETLAARHSAADRVIIYAFFHGGYIEAKYKGYEVEDEVLVLYTETEPEDYTAATADGRWMTTRAFRDLVNTLAPRELIVIIDACHAGGALHDFKYDPAGRDWTGWPGREAIIFSADDDQVGNYAPEGSVSLFTRELAGALAAAAPGASLADAFESARRATNRTIREFCKTSDRMADIRKSRNDYLLMCTQMPTSFDPFGLLDDVALRPRFINPSWHGR